MDDNTKQMIDTLSAKLGTTAEHLWGVLIRQAPIDSTINCLVAVGAACALWPLVYLGTKAFKKSEEFSNSTAVEMSCMITTVVCYGLALVCIISTGVFLCNMPMNLSGFFNPEYWAFKQIVK